MEEVRNEMNETQEEARTVLTKDMVVGDILQLSPQAAFPLMNCGMGCISCPSALMETLEQACMVHGMDADEVTKYVNAELGLIEE